MNRPSGTPLSPTNFVGKLNEGGWLVSGGRRVREIAWPLGLPVEEVSLNEGLVKIEAGDRSFEIPNDNIVITDPWTIEVREVLMRQQQRKKIEGGGWQEVPAVGVALRLSNPMIETTILKDREERDRREREERKRLEADELEAARQQFVAKLTSEFVGKTVTRIDTITDKYRLDNLLIEFEDGSGLSIELEAEEPGSWINVNGVQLDNFKSQSR